MNEKFVLLFLVICNYKSAYSQLNSIFDGEFEAVMVRRFRIVEESVNGTEVMGVAEYLRNQVNLQYHNARPSNTQSSYQLLDSHEILTRLLQIEPQTGRLFISGRIDREALCPQSSSTQSNVISGVLMGNMVDKTCLKRLSVLATVAVDNEKGVEMVTIPLELNIEDINDNPPSWNTVGKRPLLVGDSTDMLDYTVIDATILEQPVNSDFNRGNLGFNKILISAAYDPDSGINGEITYYLENFKNGNDDSIQINPVPFTITGPENGMLQLTPLQSIDYEKKNLYDLLLIAIDSGKPQQTGRAHLRIHVVDVNDESPVFTQEVFMPLKGAISERTPPGTILLNVTATDADASEANSRLRYSMAPSNNLLISKFFSVHQDGRVLLRHWLDYETLEPAHMASSPSAARAAPPASEKQFAFYVQATDSAPSPYNRTGTALVVIPIKDENDEAPIISSRFLGPPELVRHGEAGVITENSTVPVRLAYIQARDPDFNGRDRVECTVLDNTNLSLKRISPTEDASQLQHHPQGNQQPINNDFLLSLEVPVDRETTQMLVARIHCVDEANNPSDKLIRIRVLDVNDEAPNFLWQTFFFSVKENREVGPLKLESNKTGKAVPSGYRIGRVIAYDRDQDENANIIYSMLPEIEIVEPLGRPSFFPSGVHLLDFRSAKASDLFRIDSFTGEMFALQPFDAEQIELIKLRVIAIDQPTDPKYISHTGMASVQVRIIDVNDFSPIFFMTAHENDSRPQAFQPSLLDGITTVDSYIFSIPENQRAYTFVGRIGAIDPDVSFWSTTNMSSKTSPVPPRIVLQFAVDTPAQVKDALNIHAKTGQIRTTRPLDREIVANYTFNVIAVDKEPEDGLSRTSTAAVIVLVEDENDNDPVFVRPAPTGPSEKAPSSSKTVETGQVGDASEPSSLSAKVIQGQPDKVQVVAVHRVSLAMMDGSSEIGDPNNPNGRPLIQVEAHDPDAGENGEIRYSIASGDADNLFYLDPVSGSLLLKSPSSFPNPPSVSMTSEPELSYHLQLEACDMGKPKRCAMPVWLQMVMDYPSSILASKGGFRKDPNLPDASIYPNLNQYVKAGHPKLPYPAGEGGHWPAFKDHWTPHDARLNQVGFAKDWQKRAEMRDGGRDGRYTGDFGDHERGLYGASRSGVSASEAVIICLAVIFAALLFAALMLVYLVKRKSIYFSIGGRHKIKSNEESLSPDYTGGNFKHEVSTTCEGVDPSEKASLYRFIADPRDPGKIVFVDNNFDRQSLPGGAEGNMPDAVALSPMTGGKRMQVMPEYGLRRGMSVSAAVLSNLESVYISPEADCPMNASDYPNFTSRSTMAFHYPPSQTVHLRNFPDAENSQPMIFGSMVGPNGTTHPINLGTGFASPPQRSISGGEYISTDTATFQRRCSSLKPRQMTNGTPYRYIQPAGSYIYGSVVNSPARVMHCRGLSEPTTANNQVPYSPHRQYSFAEDPHTYHDIDFNATTIQRQRRMAPTLEQVAELTSSDGQPMSSHYGRLRQPSASYIYTPNTTSNRYATLAARMAPDGEVTALMEPMTLKRSLQQMVHPEVMGQRFPRQHCESAGTLNSEDFDSQSDGHVTYQSPNSFVDVENVKPTMDLNDKLLSSLAEDNNSDQTLTNRKMKPDQSDQSEPMASQASEEVATGSEATFSTLKPSAQTHPTFAVHSYREASFV